MSEPAHVPHGWLASRLGDLGRYLNGRGFGKKEWSHSGRPIIRIQNLTGTSSKFNYYGGEVDEDNIARPGDLLMSWAATLDAFIWPGPEGCVNQHIFKVESFIDKRFHFYLLRNALDELYRKTHGSGMVHITRSKFDETPAAVPPLPEQIRIVAKIEELFSGLDAGVAALERVRANLKRYRAAVLKAAVEGRLTEEWRTRHPATEPAAKLLERILAERRAKWEQDQLRKFKEAGKTPPKGWKDKYKLPQKGSSSIAPALPALWQGASLDALMSKIVDGTHHTPDYIEQGVPFLSVKDVRDGRLYFDDCKYISQQAHDELVKRCNPEVGDLLVTKSGTIGRLAVVRDPQPFSLFVSVALLKPASVLVRSDWVGIAFQRWLQTISIDNDVKGSTIKNLHLEDFRELVMPIPPLAEQAEIVAEVDRRLSVADAAETQVEHALQRAARLRQAILKRAFEGKLVPQDPTDEPAPKLLERINPVSNSKHPAPAKLAKRRRRAHA